MANGLSPKSIKYSGGSLAFSGVITSSPISEEAALTAAGSLNFRVDLKVSGVTVVGAIAAKLQHKSPGGTYSDLAGANASVSITAAGYYSLTQSAFRAADQANIPIKSMVRVVLTTTNAGDVVTVDDVWIQQEL